jgi:hypothetical protein
MLNRVKYRESKISIVGSSIVKNGFLETRSRPGGSNLCLKEGEIDKPRMDKLVAQPIRNE